MITSQEMREENKPLVPYFHDTSHKDLELPFSNSPSFTSTHPQAKSVPSHHSEKEHSHQHEAATNIFSGITFFLERSEAGKFCCSWRGYSWYGSIDPMSRTLNVSSNPGMPRISVKSASIFTVIIWTSSSNTFSRFQARTRHKINVKDINCPHQEKRELDGWKCDVPLRLQWIFRCETSTYTCIYWYIDPKYTD